MDLATIILTIRVANIILGIVSIFCASFVLVVLGLIRLYDGRLVDRISLRLCACISLVDIGRSIGIIMYFQVVGDGPLCIFSAMVNNFMILSHMMLTAAIALNLQLVVLNHKTTQRWWEPTYYGMGILFPLALTGIMAGVGAFGYDKYSATCFYKDVYTGTIYSHVKLWVGFLAWNALGPIYCLMVVILTTIKLRTHSKPRLVNVGKRNAHTQSAVSAASISLLIRRVCFYCFVPIISQSGCVFGLIWEEVHGHVPYWIAIFDSVASHSSGILNLIGFLNDPALRNSIISIRSDLEAGERNPSIYHRRPRVYRALRFALLKMFPNFYPQPGFYHLSRGIGPNSFTDPSATKPTAAPQPSPNANPNPFTNLHNDTKLSSQPDSHRDAPLPPPPTDDPTVPDVNPHPNRTVSLPSGVTPRLHLPPDVESDSDLFGHDWDHQSDHYTHSRTSLPENPLDLRPESALPVDRTPYFYHVQGL